MAPVPAARRRRTGRERARERGPTMPSRRQLDRLAARRGGGRRGRHPRAASLGLFLDPAQFFRSYLFAFLFWIGIALGCLSHR